MTLETGHDSAGQVQFDPLVGNTVRDPHELYKAMRAQCPVAHSDRFGGF